MSVSEAPAQGKSRQVRGITVRASGTRGQAQQTLQDTAWKEEAQGCWESRVCRAAVARLFTGKERDVGTRPSPG